MAFKKKTQALAIPTSGRKKAKGIGFESVKVPQKWLLPAHDGTEPFTPVIDFAAVERHQALRGTTAMFALLPTLPAVMGGIALESLTSSLLLDFAGWGIVGASATLAVLGALRSDRLEAKRRKALQRYARGALDDWLLARYNLKIRHLLSGDTFLYRYPSVGDSMEFVDEQARSFRLIKGTSGIYVEEVHNNDYTPAGTVAALTSQADESELANLLTGEAQALRERMVELLTKLAKRTLSTEGQHIVKRVQEDVRQTLVINRELQEIDGADDDSRAELAAVLSALNDELDEVLEAERQLVRDGLSTQLGYVKGRRRHISKLQLLPARADAKIQIQEEEWA